MARGEITEVTGSLAAKNVGNMRLEENAGLGVNQMEHGGGSPPGNPVEGTLEGGGPRGGEDVEDVAFGCESLSPVVLGVMVHGLGDQALQVAVLVDGGRRPGSRGQLAHQLAQVVEPVVVEGAEAGHSMDLGGNF